MNSNVSASIRPMSDAETQNIAGGIPFLAYPYAVVVVAAEMAKEHASQSSCTPE